MDASKLAESIRQDTDCLWATISRIRHGEQSLEEVIDAKACYCRLKVHRAQYYESRLDVLDSVYLWFVDQVVDAFEDIYTRFILLK